ncbi:hypothetical protein ACFQ4L_06960 [Lapidilactobacillus mulanensis]|uniref:Uncharacterized protein n=1 Tax=Lapidilactobacillus mulanensis TaxID=2485999 RepID=A0ABW4DMA6_9LACO
MSQNAEEKITDHCEIVLVGLNLIFKANQKSSSKKQLSIKLKSHWNEGDLQDFCGFQKA